MNTGLNRTKWEPYIWLLPSVLLIAIFVIFPILIVFKLSFSKDKGFINVRTIASHANASFMGTFSSHGLALPKQSFRTECKVEGKTITFSVAALVAEQKAAEKGSKK